MMQQALDPTQGASNPTQITPDHVQEINMKLDILKRRTQESEEDLRRMIQCQEAFGSQYQERTKQQAQVQQSGDADLIAQSSREMILLDAGLRKQIIEILRTRVKSVQSFQKMYIDLSEFQKRILDTELVKWKRAQQMVGNGEPFIDNLNQIHEWCERLADIIWQNRQQIRQVEKLSSRIPLNLPENVVKLPMLNNQITELLSSLVASSLIIVKQPPQVLRTNNRFAATAQFLFSSIVNVHTTPPQVKVTIISEAQAIALLKTDKSGETSGEILNNMGKMEYQQENKQLSVNFRNLQLRKIIRPEKKDYESVTDEKFCLLFDSRFQIKEGLKFHVLTLSLPMVVTVSNCQETRAWATITWDNAFAEAGRVPFQVPDKISWKEVRKVLSDKFKAVCGRYPSDDNMEVLAMKLFRSDVQVDDGANVSWFKFCKEPLPHRNFSFWDWFSAIMEVTREHLRNLWNDGLIIGFIGRPQAEEMLMKKCDGTFLLRFSDSVLGGVTIAFVADSQKKEGKEVFMIQPFTSKDFSIRSIVDRIYDLKCLPFLYPDIPKDQAFEKYYTPLSGDSNADGYLKPLLVTHLQGNLICTSEKQLQKID